MRSPNRFSETELDRVPIAGVARISASKLGSGDNDETAKLCQFLKDCDGSMSVASSDLSTFSTTAKFVEVYDTPKMKLKDLKKKPPVVIRPGKPSEDMAR
jgi:hypothetical protein